MPTMIQAAIAFLLLNSLLCSSFVLEAPATMIKSQHQKTHPAAMTATSLSAKKRRRRKQPTGEEGPASSSLPDFDIDEDASDIPDSGALPDFEIDDMASSKRRTSATGGTGMAADLSVVTDAMMGSAGKQPASLDDLIRDRSLEQKLAFDESEIDQSIPVFEDLARSSGRAPSADISADGVGISKKERREAARAAAIAEREEEERKEEILSKIPFITNNEGKVTGVSILEAGTWLGIFLLVGWEVYINSPLFERAAPMAPVVYNLIP